MISIISKKTAISLAIVGVLMLSIASANVLPPRSWGSGYKLYNINGTYWDLMGENGVQNGSMVNMTNISAKRMGGIVYAENYPTIQAAIDNLTSGRTWVETVYVKGDWTESDIRIPSYTKLIIDGRITRPAGNDTHRNNVLKLGYSALDGDNLTSASNIFIEGGIIDGNRDSDSDFGIDGGQVGIYGSSIQSFSIKDVTIVNTWREGIYLHGSAWGTVDNIYVSKAGRACIESDANALMTWNTPKGSHCNYNGASGLGGLDIVGGSTLLPNSVNVFGGTIWNSSGYGLRVSFANGSNIYGLELRDNGDISAINPQGAIIRDSSNILLDGLIIKRSRQNGVWFYKTNNSKLVNSILENNSVQTSGNYYALLLTSSYNNTILNNGFGGVGSYQKKGISEVTSDRNTVLNNNLLAMTTVSYSKTGQNSAFYNNLGASPFFYGTTTNTSNVTAFGEGDTVINLSNPIPNLCQSNSTSHWLFAHNGTAGC